MIVKDSMVLIHLAKMTIAEKSCNYFKKVLIPETVYKECIGEKEYQDSAIIDDIVKKGKIKVVKITNKNFIKKANAMNIFGGEAEAVALCWQENSELVATDDDNVRKKQPLLGIQLIGTPAILLKLYKEKIINKNKFKDSVKKLKEIGWFSSTIFDKLMMEAK